MKRATRILITANLRYRMMDFRYPGVPCFWWKSLVLVWFINEFQDQNFGNFMIQNHSRDPIGVENRELGTQKGFNHLLPDFLTQYEARSSNSRHSQSSISDDGFSISWYPVILRIINDFGTFYQRTPDQMISMIQNHTWDPIGIENRELGTETAFKHLLTDFLTQYEARSLNSRHSQSSMSDDGFSISWYPVNLMISYVFGMIYQRNPWLEFRDFLWSKTIAGIPPGSKIESWAPKQALNTS